MAMENKNLNIENQEAVETKAKSELNTQENLEAPTKQHKFNLNIWQDPKKRKLFGQIFYPIWIGLLIAGVIAIVCVRTSYGLTDQSDSITYIIAVIMGVLLVAGTIISAFYQKNEPIDENTENTESSISEQNEDTPPSNQDATASQNAEEANLNIIENTKKTNSATSKNTNEINSNTSPITDETSQSTAENTNKIDSNNSQNAKK